MQQDQPLCLKLGSDEIDAGRVPAWPIETGDEAIFDGVVAGREYDRNGRAGCLGCPRRGRAASKDHSYLSAHQFGCEGWQSTVLTVCPTEIHRDLLALDVAGRIQTRDKCAVASRIRRPAVQKPNHWD